MATTPLAGFAISGTTLRAIACHNPHAIRIAQGLKRIETRRWKTNYRGPLLVCSTVRPKIFPNGFALCIAELVDCRKMVKDDEPLAWVKLWNAYSWVLTRIRPITPFKVTGYQKFFRVTVPEGIAYQRFVPISHQAELFAAE